MCDGWEVGLWLGCLSDDDCRGRVGVPLRGSARRGVRPCVSKMGYLDLGVWDSGSGSRRALQLRDVARPVPTARARSCLLLLPKNDLPAWQSSG